MVNTFGDDRRHRILAVIVLYKTLPENSLSYQTLLQAQVLAPDLDLAVILYDNSPGAEPPQGLSANTKYIADANNSGLAAAYNLCLQMCLDEDYDWMLTLDQDTSLPQDTFRILKSILNEIYDRTDVAAIVPEIRVKNRIISPSYFAGGVWPRFFKHSFSGISDRAVYAFNSGSLLRSSALRQIGGYDPRFWLDNSDHMLYRKLARFGKRAYIAGQWKVEHDLSVLNEPIKISAERYGNLLLAESAFWDLEMNTFAGLERTYRLLGRYFRNWLRGDDSRKRKLTFKALSARLFRIRAQRLADWAKESRQRLDAAPCQPLRLHRPMVSVCMAAYNGGPYIEAQLRSVLPQLGPHDEIIIVDDASTDDTVARIENFRHQAASLSTSPKIKLSRRTINQGVVRNFEQALRQASGDILFLCDDDDLWAADKVKKMLTVFQRDTEVALVASDFAGIDKNGNLYEDALFKKRHNFRPGFISNLLQSPFQGSTMAFRATLLKTILPIPADRKFIHDAWIGTRSTFTRKKMVFVDEPLLLYRRHDGNYSQRLSRLDQIRVRLQLIAACARRALG